MTEFDYNAPAELYAAQGRRGFRYRRFFNAGEAIRYAIESSLPISYRVPASRWRSSTMTANKSAHCMRANTIL